MPKPALVLLACVTAVPAVVVACGVAATWWCEHIYAKRQP